MKKIILLSALIVISVVSLGQVAYAASSSLYVSPATISKNVNATFNVSVNLDAQGNQVCVIKGTLSFNNLTCQSISVNSGIMAQTAPTCAEPSFTLGIPGCTTAAKNVLSVSVKGNSAGQATLSLTGVKVIGAGVVVSSTANGGTYNITAAPTPTPTPTPTTAPASTLTAYNTALSAVTESDYTAESWATYQAVVTANPASIENTQAEIDTATANITAAQSSLVLKAGLTTTPDNGIPASAGTAGLASVASQYFWPILIILIILVVGYGIYYFVKRKK